MRLRKNVYRIFSSRLIFLRTLGFLTRFFFIYRRSRLFIEWEITKFNRARIVIRVLLDWISCVFLRSVFLIAGSIRKFSDYYIAEDKDYVRFIILLIRFVLSIVFLIIRPNIIRILLGWDGLGLTSYILVIYYQNENSCNAGILTVLSNRIGDVCILLRIGLLFYKGTWNFIYYETLPRQRAVVLLIIVAGITKRAQIPFSAWLPAAIAAPTPVSRLVHSSTLVTAGVYLLIRFTPCIQGRGWLNILFILSILTILISGWGANFEVDIKKIIALSTLSQLGLIIMIVRVGMPALAFFHLISHAIFKSTLFICGGTIIHISDGSQDARTISSLNTSSPFLRGVFSLTNLALLGFPFLAGFYSKDLVLESLFRRTYNYIIIFIVVAATGITVSYSLRAIFLGISRVRNLKRVSELIDRNKTLITCIRILRLFRVSLGLVFSWDIFWSRASLVLTRVSKYYILTVCLAAGILIFQISNNYSNKIVKKRIIILNALRRIWFLPFIRTKKISAATITLGIKIREVFDKGWLEYYGGQGGQTLLLRGSNLLQKRQTTVIIRSYLLRVGFFLLFRACVFC